MEEIRQRQEEDISKVSGVLSISRDAACILLRHYKWSVYISLCTKNEIMFFGGRWHFNVVNFFFIAFRNVTKVPDEWFANEESVRKEVGLLEEPVEIPNSGEVSICYTVKFVF